MEKRNKKILVICPHPVGYVPGQRLKYEQYFQHWGDNGYDVTVSPFMSEEMQRIVYKKGYLLKKVLYTIGGYYRKVVCLFTIRKYDIVYLFLWATPFGPPFFEWLIRKLSRRMVYDIDDLVFLKNVKHENKYLRLIKGKNKPFFLMKHAEHVITCTPYLDSIAKKYNRNTTDISSTINTDTYIPVNTYQNDHCLILGWSGSHSTVQYLYLLKDVLTALKEEIDFQLLVIGDENFKMDGIEIEAYNWSEEAEIPLLQKIDIGLYPLPNEEWVLGKSGLKALQYMALGIPTIATNVGCNDRVIENNVSGYLVNNDQQWLEKLKELIANPELRRSVGLNARKRVEQHFSIKANAAKYLEIVNSVAS